MSTDTVSSVEMYEKEKELLPKEWDSYFEEVLDEINIYVVVSYNIEYQITNNQTMTIRDRDNHLNLLREEIALFILEFNKEEIKEDRTLLKIEVKLAELAIAYSDESIKINCKITNFEKDWN